MIGGIYHASVDGTKMDGSKEDAGVIYWMFTFLLYRCNKDKSVVSFDSIFKIERVQTIGRHMQPIWCKLSIAQYIPSLHHSPAD